MNEQNEQDKEEDSTWKRERYSQDRLKVSHDQEEQAGQGFRRRARWKGQCFYDHSNMLLDLPQKRTACRLTVSVTRGWAGRENAALTEPTSSHANCQKTRRIPLVGCTLCWAVLTLLTFSVRVRYPLRDGSWSDRQDQRAIPVGAPCH